MTARRDVSDLLVGAKSMPGAGSAELYADTAAQVCRRSLQHLFQGVSPLCLRPEQTVLDIGCGTGEATTQLLNILPDVVEIEAVDMSANFISYAQEFNRDETISFSCMNVESEWAEEWNNKFTMVFSNYVWHWINDHKKLLQRINRSMQLSGDMVVQFFHSALQNEDEMRAATKAARECGILKEMQSAIMSRKKQMPVWKDPVEYMNLINSMGFKVKKCEVVDRHFQCDSAFERAGMTVVVSPFMLHVPVEKRLLFATKYVANLKDPFTIHHKAVVVHAIKVKNL